MIDYKETKLDDNVTEYSFRPEYIEELNEKTMEIAEGKQIIETSFEDGVMRILCKPLVAL